MIESQLFLGDTRIVGAWMRGHWDGPSPADYEAASKRIEAAGREGNEAMENQEVVEGGKNSEDHSGPVQFFYESHQLVGGREYLTRC